ncbi:hypothetical protein ACP70R_018276 [Stipagrostis hirtigluma subsp. patula]
MIMLGRKLPGNVCLVMMSCLTRVADYESPVAGSELDGYGLDIRKKSSLIPSKIEDDLSKKVSQSKKVKRN